MDAGHQVHTEFNYCRTLANSLNSYPHIIGFNASQRQRLDRGKLLKWINVDFPFRRTCNTAVVWQQCV
jgi:hypothetical protein